MQETYQAISQAVLEGDDAKAAALTREALAANLPVLEILQKGAVEGINQTGVKWQKNEYFLPDVIMAAEAFKATMKILDPELKKTQTGHVNKKLIIGVVEGDMHELGKSLVVAMATAAGYDVIDLGVNVSIPKWVEAVKTHQPDLVGIGAYMTTTMLQMKDIIAELKRQGLLTKTKVIIGGVSTSQTFAEQMGADGWGHDAISALQTMMVLSGGKNG
jgi:5-methyltetrahydrofolate--homocysteine methyltransferase